MLETQKEAMTKTRQSRNISPKAFIASGRNKGVIVVRIVSRSR